MSDVQIIHPDLGPASITTVPEQSLPHHYRAGWRLLTEDETPPKTPAQPPPPMTRAEAAKTAKAAKTAADKE